MLDQPCVQIYQLNSPEPPGTALREADVHIWYFSFCHMRTHIDELLNSLSGDELARIGRIYFLRDKQRFILSRGILRVLLSHYLSIPETQVRFVYNQFGKPFLDPRIYTRVEDQGLSFNLSHSGDYSVYAVARQRRLGIDIEQIRTLPNLQQLAHQILSTEEYQTFERVPQAEQTLAFLNCWTQKEAYSKATGLGLAIPFDTITVPLVSPTPNRMYNIVGRGEQWHIQMPDIVRGYICALVVDIVRSVR